MAYIDELKKQINKAQAEAMRKNDSISSQTDQTFADTVKIISDIRAEETAKKQAAQAAATQPTDTRTTAQKAADAQSAYDAYMGSEEQKINQQEANRQAVWAAMDRIFAAGPGVSASDMPMNIVSVNPVDTKKEELKATADYYKTQQKAEENQKVLDAKLAEYETWSAEDKAALDQYMNARENEQNSWFTAGAMHTYNPTASKLIQDKGLDEVRKMAEAVQRSRNAKIMEETTAAANKVAEKTPVLGSAASVGANLLSSFGTGETIKELANRTGQFSTLDSNNLGSMGSQFGSTVRQNVGQQIEGEDGNVLRKLAASAYEGGMSIADSAARLAAGGGSPGVSAVIAASGSFNNSLRQYSAQGATPEQAAAAAIVTSGIEYLTEKIPMDELLKVGKGGWKDLLKQTFLTEPTAEEISLFANTAAETLILGKNSDRSQKIGELVANGATYKEAQEQVNKELWKEAGKTYASSAFAGLFGGGGAQILDRMQTQQLQEQQAIEKLGAELAKNVVEPAKAQPTEGEKLLQQATDALLGVSEDTDNTSSIKDQIRQSQNALNKMEPVANIQTPQGFSDMTKTERKSWVINKLQPTSYKVDRKGFGIIKFAEKQLKAAFNYLKRGSVEEASFEALPYVLEHGTEISSHPAHKDREYGTVTFAAPVVINGKRGNMAVVVKQTTENFYKVHRILTPEGTVFDLSDTKTEAEPSLAGESPEIGSLATPISSASVNNIPETEVNVKGTGAAEQNFSGHAAYDELLSDDNVQRQRPEDARQEEVPKYDAQGRTVSESVGNIMNSKATPDSFTDTIKRIVQEGKVSHDVQTNEESLKSAANALSAENNLYDSVQRIKKFAAEGNTGPKYIAEATLLYEYLTDQIDKKTQSGAEVDAALQGSAEDIFISLSEMATASGRALQLYNLFRKMTPEGQTRILQKEIQKEIEKLQARGVVKKDYQPAIDDRLLEQYREVAKEYQDAKDAKEKAEAAEELAEIQNVIYQHTAAQLPTTFKAKWDAWRYMAMLGNAKTQARNFLGNAFMVPYTEAKRIAGAVMETGISKDQRTKSVFQDKELLQWAKEDSNAELIHKTLEKSGQLGDMMATTQLSENLRIFKNGLLEGVRNGVNTAVTTGDMIFKNASYQSSLASFIKARGYTAEDIHTGKVGDDVLNEARNYAINEALKATFNDSNAFSDAISSIRFKNPDNAVKKAINALGEGIMPFRKTPANIVVRFKDYSPAGLAQGLWNMAFNVRNGKVSAATAIDQLASGLTGSAVAWLGYALAGGLMGIKLTGSGSDEDEKRQGHQDYALEFSWGGKEYSYKIDWASPANLPLFLGANLRKVAEEMGGADTASLISAWANVGLGVLEPLLELSCLSSINDMFESAKYAPEGEAVYNFLATGATSYFTQGIPALLRQTVQAIQPDKQTTFANAEDPIVRKAQQAAAKIPGVFQTEKRNAWGETESTESGWVRAINAYFNPGTLKQISNDPVEMELNRLKAEGKDITPPAAAKTVSYTDKTGAEHEKQRLTEEQYQTLAKTQGQTAKKLLDQIINSQDYKALTAMQQEAAVKAVYEYAAEAGKKAALPDYYSQADAWISRVDADPVNGIIQRGAEKVLESVVSNAVESLKNGWEVAGAAKKDMNESFDAYDKMSTKAKQELLDQITGDALKYLEVRSGGVSTDQYLQAVEDVKQLEPEEGYTSVRDTQTREAIANSGLDAEVIDTIMKAYMKDYDPEDDKPDKTELRYEYVRQELGYSPKEYAAIYRVQADGGKKDEKITAWMELGYTRQEATILYNLFESTGKQAIDVVKWHNEQ